MLFSPGSGGGGILSYTQAQRNALTPSNGTVIFNTTSLRVEQYDSTTGIWRYVGDPLSINYIRNYSGEGNATTGWATYADAAGTTPVDGTGGSPSVTWALNTSSPLRGQADFLFTKDAVNRQGQGVSYDFTIDSADQARQLQISFDYKIASGTYASGDITVWVYDVTNAVLLSQPSGNSLISTSIPSQQTQCVFQTASNSTSYRLIFHVTTTSASAYTIEFDNISVGPQAQTSGAVDTAWTQYTPTLSGNGFGTPTSINFWYRRNGPDLEVIGSFTTGTTTTSSGPIPLPSGLSIDTSVLTLANTTSNPGHNVGVLDANGAANLYGNIVTATGTSATQVYLGGAIGSTSMLTPTSNVSGAFGIGNTAAVRLYFRVPIAGWASNTVLSTSTNTRTIAAEITTAGTLSTTSGSALVFTTVAYDTSASYNASTGQYTCPVPGYYRVSYAGMLTTTTNINFSLYRGGSAYRKIGGVGNSGSVVGSGTITILCVAGDVLTLVPDATTTLLYSATVYQPTIMFELIQGPQQIAASERIAFRATTSNTAGTVSTPFVYSVKDYDTHNAYSTSTGVFTAPAPGIYHFSVVSSSTSASAFITIYKNGTIFQYGSTGSNTLVGVLACEMNLVAGDTIDTRPSGNQTSVNSSTQNVFSGFRIGGTT